MSTDKLQGLIQGGGDFIPREYHRKVLKKIAQLTKVIYALNTRNDENEQIIAKLKATHEDDLDKVLAGCTHKLQQCKEDLALRHEFAENKIVSLEECLAVTERERDKLQKEQISYRSTVEERLAAIKSQYSDNILSLTKQLEELRSSQIQQLKEANDLCAEFSKKSSKQTKEIERKHLQGIEDLRMHFSKHIISLESNHKKEMESLTESFKDQLEAQSMEMTKSHHEELETKNIFWEERIKIMEHDFLQKEDQLKNQISTLSNDLRTSKDKLALSEQKVTELCSKFEEGKVGSVELQIKLKDAEDEVERLKIALREAKNELDISRQHYQQQLTEMKGMGSTLGKLEALRASNESAIENLNSRISSLQLKMQLLEEERDTLKASQLNSDEQQSAQIRTLEKMLEKMRREAQDMHIQYAREIEAAQAQLGERETQLMHEHLKTLQQLRDENKQVLLDAGKDKDAALEKLEKQMDSRREEELSNLRKKLEDEITCLRNSLSDKSNELMLAQKELKKLESDLARREQGLGSVSSELERLKRELKEVQEDLVTVKGEREETLEKNNELQTTVEGLKEQAKEMDKNHQDQLVKLRIKLTKELEDSWKERLKHECGVLRHELSMRHEEDSRVALAELANLKDKAMELAREEWDSNKKKLLNSILDLEKKVQEMQNVNSASLKEVTSASNSQIASLREELEEQNEHYTNLLEQQRQLNLQEIEAIQKKFDVEKDLLVKDLSDQHAKEEYTLHQANQLAVATLRETLEQQSQERVEQARLRHEREIEEMREELLSEHKKNEKKLCEEHRMNLHRHQREMEKLLAERTTEISHHEGMVSSLCSDIEMKDAELSKLRNNVNSLTVAVANIRKELEVKGNEVLATRREANAILQQRVSEISTAHNIEMESLITQHKHHSQTLLTEFNNAKAIFVSKIKDLEKQVTEWEERYESRASKPEDIEMIRELKLATQEQKQRIKDLIGEKRVYQLELMNREKNYNKIFSANPHVGVLNPLASKHKNRGSEIGIESRYPSAPSLVSPSPEPSLPPLASPIPTCASFANGLITAQGIPKRYSPQLEAKSKMINAQQKFSGSKGKGVAKGNNNMTPSLNPLNRIPSSAHTQKPTMAVVQ